MGARGSRRTSRVARQAKSCVDERRRAGYPQAGDCDLRAPMRAPTAALARSKPIAPGSAVAKRVVPCVFRRAAGSQHTTTRHAPHAPRRRRQIRPRRLACSAQWAEAWGRACSPQRAEACCGGSAPRASYRSRTLCGDFGIRLGDDRAAGGARLAGRGLARGGCGERREHAGRHPHFHRVVARRNDDRNARAEHDAGGQARR